MQANVQATQRSGGLDYKWILAMVVVLGAFMSVLDSTIVNIALPRLETAFGADVNSVQWVLTGYTLVQGVVTPLAAFLCDRYGIKRFYIFSLAAFTIGSALCGLAWSLPMLIAFRILQAAGGAALMPLSLTLLFQVFPPEERGAAMGLFGVPVLLAPAIGPTLGGYLVTFSGWQLIFYINVPIGIVAVILATIFIRGERSEKRPSFDALGFIFVAIGLATGLYGLSSASTDGWSSGTVVGCLITGFVCLAIFIAIELNRTKREKDPLLDLRLFRNGAFSTSVIANVLITFALFGGLFLFPIYLQNMRSLSAYQAGLTLLPQALASMVATLIGGRLVDRIGVKAVVIPGLLIMGISTWCMTFLDSHTPFAWFQFLLILRGLSLGVSIQPLSVSMMADVRPRDLAQASSVSTVARAVSSSLGIAVLATVVSTQSSVHYGHLAELVTPFSKLGSMVYEFQAYFVSQGASAVAAHSAALQYISLLIKSQAFILSMQDAFRLTIVVIIAAIVAVLSIRKKKGSSSDAPMSQEEIEEMKKARAEAMAG
jgi:EmrB/QacA subfamily drug resistance transporter